MRRFILIFTTLLVGWYAEAQNIQTLHATRFLPEQTTVFYGSPIVEVPKDLNFLDKEYDLAITLSDKMIIATMTNKLTGSKEVHEEYEILTSLEKEEIGDQTVEILVARMTIPEPKELNKDRIIYIIRDKSNKIQEIRIQRSSVNIFSFRKR